MTAGLIENISTIYTKALLNVLGSNIDYLLPVQQIAEMFSDDELIYKYFFDPRVSSEEKIGFISDVLTLLKAKPIIIDFFHIIIQSDRGILLPAIISDLNIQRQAKIGMLKVKILSPYLLSNSTRINIVTSLSKKLRKKLLVDYIEDFSMIGGIKIFYENIEIDLSVRNILEQIRRIPLYG